MALVGLKNILIWRGQVIILSISSAIHRFQPVPFLKVCYLSFTTLVHNLTLYHRLSLRWVLELFYLLP